jgi:hypothetical protein
MAENGVRTTNQTPATIVDELIGNRDGSTVRIDMSRVAAQVRARIGPSYETKAALDADLDWPAGAVGTVWNDGSSANNGDYLKSGASGSGSWTKMGASALAAAVELAMKWAAEDEDEEVTTGEYSAKHHALKALAHKEAAAAQVVLAQDQVGLAEDQVALAAAQVSLAADEVSAAAAERAIAENQAAVATAAADQAQLAALAVGAGLFLSIAAGLAGTADGDPFMVTTGPGTAVYQNDGGSEAFQGWLGDIAYDSAAAVKAGTETGFLEGQVIRARKGSFAYEVAASGATDHHMETAGGVKLYAKPNCFLWITSEQLAWADDDDVTTDIARFWSRFSAGDKFLLCHKVLLGNVTLTMPDHFTLQAAKLMEDGFEFSDASWPSPTTKFTLGDHCTVRGIAFTGTLSGETNGEILAGGTSGVAYSLVRPVIEHCVFDVLVDQPVLLVNSDGLVLTHNRILEGYWKVNLYGGRNAYIAHNFCTAGDFANNECFKVSKELTTGALDFAVFEHNYFYELRRDGIDTTGGIQNSVIRNNQFIRCGGGPGGVGGVGKGGIDLKTTQTDRLAPIEPNQNVLIEGNYFEDSHCGVVSNWNDDWTDPTRAEIYQYGSHNIHLRNNRFNKTGAPNTTCGAGLNGGLFTLDGDEFEGGATWWLGSGAVSISGKNLVVEMTTGMGAPSIVGTEHVSLHFAELRIAEAGTTTVEIEDCANVHLSGKILAHGGGTIFEVLNPSASVSATNLRFSFEGVYTGASTGPLLVDIDRSGDAGYGVLTVKDCNLDGFDQLVFIRGGGTAPDVDLLLIKDNVWLNGGQAMVDFQTLSNTANITAARLVGNIGDGTTALHEGTTTNIGTLTTSENFGFV